MRRAAPAAVGHNGAVRSLRPAARTRAAPSRPASLPPALWFDGIELPAARSPLPGPSAVDIAIVGAGFTGLWTAFYLTQALPDASIAVIESQRAGFGASGRNGGWCISEVAAGAERWDALSGPGAGARMDAAMHATVDEIASVVAEQGIECDWSLGGELHLARNGGQAERLRREVGEPGVAATRIEPFGSMPTQPASSATPPRCEAPSSPRTPPPSIRPNSCSGWPRRASVGG